MGATRATLRGFVENYVAELSTEFTTAKLNAWLDEGHRRLAPVLLQEKIDTVTSGGTTTKIVALPADCVYVLRVWSGDEELPDWREHAGSMVFTALVSANIDIEVEYLGSWDVMGSGESDQTPLAGWQQDAVVFYAVARAFREYQAGRADYKKFSTAIDGRVSSEDVDNLAAYWQEEFQRARVEARTHRQILYETERQAGARPTGDGL